MRRIFLDHAATTPPAAEAVEAVQRAMEMDWGNASSAHSVGQTARRIVDSARAAVAGLIGARPEEIVFTSGATESNNQAIKGAVEVLKGRGDRIAVSAVEHTCVLESSAWSARQGWAVARIPVDSGGILDLSWFGRDGRNKAALVSVMLANNETGAIEPVAEAARLAKPLGALFHTDATQAIGRIPVDVNALGVDYLSLSAHKFYGPKGVGALWVRKGAPLAPFLSGGSQERGKRAGTLNVPGIAGLGAAAELARRNMEAWMARSRAARDRLEAGILARIPGAAVNGDRVRRLPSHLSVSFEGVDGEALLMALDVAGVAVSTGSACASGTAEPSHVLQAMGLPRARALSTIRFTLGEANADGDAEAALDALVTAVERLRKSSPRG